MAKLVTIERCERVGDWAGNKLVCKRSENHPKLCGDFVDGVWHVFNPDEPVVEQVYEPKVCV